MPRPHRLNPTPRKVPKGVSQADHRAARRLTHVPQETASERRARKRAEAEARRVGAPNRILPTPLWARTTPGETLDAVQTLSRELL